MYDFRFYQAYMGQTQLVTCFCILYNLILDGKDVDVDFLMVKLEHEDQPYSQGEARKYQNNANVGINEVNLVLEGKKCLDSRIDFFLNHT
jgi:hypothetical protein